MTPYDPQLHHRRSIRLKGYDYTLPGAYFVTLVTWQRKNLFGQIAYGTMNFSRMGEIVHSVWSSLPDYFPIRNESWVIMPNHLHAILWILDISTGEASASVEFQDPVRGFADASPQRRPIGTGSNSLGAIIQNFKSVSTRKINRCRGETLNNQRFAITQNSIDNPSPSTHLRIWQRNYYERIIRNQAELENTHLYITENSRRWSEDQENLERSR